MTHDGYMAIGSFLSLHGYKGQINIYLNVKINKNFKFIEPVFVEFNQTWVPFFIEEFSEKNKKRFIVKIKDINSENDALKFKSKKLYVTKSFYNKHFENENEFLYLMGYEVHDRQHGFIGCIKDVLEYPGQYIFKITGLQEEEILIPVNSDFIERIIKKTKKIHITTPEGLLDIYIKK